MSLISIIVAVARNGVIGRDNGLPWRLSTDLRRFRALTMGKPLVMGRKTFESIGRPLDGRRNIVVSGDQRFSAAGIEIARDPAEALGFASDAPEICVIGGARIFSQLMPDADRLHVTHILAAIEGDVVLPSIDGAVWKPASAEDVPAGPRDTHPTRYIVYERAT